MAYRTQRSPTLHSDDEGESLLEKLNPSSPDFGRVKNDLLSEICDDIGIKDSMDLDFYDVTNDTVIAHEEANNDVFNNIGGGNVPLDMLESSLQNKFDSEPGQYFFSHSEPNREKQFASQNQQHSAYNTSQYAPHQSSNCDQVSSSQQRDFNPYAQRSSNPYSQRDMNPHAPKDPNQYGQRDSNQYGQRDSNQYDPRDSNQYDHRNVNQYTQRDPNPNAQTDAKQYSERVDSNHSQRGQGISNKPSVSFSADAMVDREPSSRPESQSRAGSPLITPQQPSPSSFTSPLSTGSAALLHEELADLIENEKFGRMKTGNAVMVANNASRINDRFPAVASPDTTVKQSPKPKRSSTSSDPRGNTCDEPPPNLSTRRDMTNNMVRPQRRSSVDQRPTSDYPAYPQQTDRLKQQNTSISQDNRSNTVPLLRPHSRGYDTSASQATRPTNTLSVGQGSSRPSSISPSDLGYLSSEQDCNVNRTRTPDSDQYGRVPTTQQQNANYETKVYRPGVRPRSENCTPEVSPGRKQCKNEVDETRELINRKLRYLDNQSPQVKKEADLSTPSICDFNEMKNPTNFSMESQESLNFPTDQRRMMNQSDMNPNVMNRSSMNQSVLNESGMVQNGMLNQSGMVNQTNRMLNQNRMMQQQQQSSNHPNMMRNSGMTSNQICHDYNGQPMGQSNPAMRQMNNSFMQRNVAHPNVNTNNPMTNDMYNPNVSMQNRSRPGSVMQQMKQTLSSNTPDMRRMNSSFQQYHQDPALSRNMTSNQMNRNQMRTPMQSSTPGMMNMSKNQMAPMNANQMNPNPMIMNQMNQMHNNEFMPSGQYVNDENDMYYQQQNMMKKQQQQQMNNPATYHHMNPNQRPPSASQRRPVSNQSMMTPQTMYRYPNGGNHIPNKSDYQYDWTQDNRTDFAQPPPQKQQMYRQQQAYPQNYPQQQQQQQNRQMPPNVSVTNQRVYPASRFNDRPGQAPISAHSTPLRPHSIDPRYQQNQRGAAQMNATASTVHAPQNGSVHIYDDSLHSGLQDSSVAPLNSSSMNVMANCSNGTTASMQSSAFQRMSGNNSSGMNNMSTVGMPPTPAHTQKRHEFGSQQTLSDNSYENFSEDVNQVPTTTPAVPRRKPFGDVTNTIAAQQPPLSNDMFADAIVDPALAGIQFTPQQSFIQSLVSNKSTAYRSHPLFPLLRDLIIADLNFNNPTFPYRLIANLPKDFDRLLQNYASRNKTSLNYEKDAAKENVMMDALKYAHKSLIDKIAAKNRASGEDITSSTNNAVEDFCSRFDQSIRNSFSINNENSGYTNAIPPKTLDPYPTPSQNKPRPRPEVDKENAGLNQSNNNGRKHPILPKEAVNVMLEWLRHHRHNPYPNDEEKEELQRRTKLSVNQINYWFTNARRRILPRWAMAEMGQVSSTSLVQ